MQPTNNAAGADGSAAECSSYFPTGPKPRAVWADAGARYCREEVVDISGLGPVVSLPGSPSSVVPVEQVAGTRVDSVFIGSCTNGRHEDFAAAAAILRGKQVAPGLMAKAVPATRGVFGALLEDGLMADLVRAGVIVSNPGCGGCASGQIGMTGKGEVQISTSNRNFRGKQGMGETYLASPATAAASALCGKIAAATAP